MREIKYRGKRLDNGEWVEGSLYQDYDCPECASIIPIGSLEQKIYPSDTIYAPSKHYTATFIVTGYDVDPTTVGQYTERKDIEGKPLYDGDLCVNHGGDITAQIVWNERTLMWGLKVTSSKSVLTRGMTFPLNQYFDVETGETALKKVGNIYENSDLYEQ